jgi:hypothetical protein
MDIALFPMLFFMIVDGFEKLSMSTRCIRLLDIIDSGKLKPEEIGVQRYEAMKDWSPFWNSGVSLFESADQDEGKKLQAEVKNVKGTLDAWFPKGKTNGEKEEKLSKEALSNVIDKVEGDVPKLRLEGYREFLYFVLNFIAFYGYLMAPLAFFYEDEEKQPFHIQAMKFYYNNEVADWTGNFAGDLMWTIEPLVILGSPFIIQMAKPKSVDKVKSD